MIKKQLFAYIFSFMAISPLLGMDSNKSMTLRSQTSSTSNQPKALQPANRSFTTNTPIKITPLPTTILPSIENKGSIRFTSNYKENYPYLVNKVYDDENLKHYAAEQFVFNQDESIKKMNAAKARGANVYLTVGAHSENKLDKYKTTTIKRDPNIHGKFTVGLDQSPSKKSPKKGIFQFGSFNLSNSTWQHKPGKAGTQFNFESGIEVENDMDIIPQAYKMVKSQSPMKSASEKTTIQNTPEKISLYGSKDTNLNKSLALRLNNAAAKQGTAAIRSMTFSDKEVANALSKFGPKAELIVDYSALTSTGIPLLQQVNDSKASVHVFYPTKGSRSKQHSKDAVIETKDKKMYISSTANITKEGDSQRNYQLYIPNNDIIIDDAKEDFANVKKETITFSEALKLKNADNKQKTEKRKLEAEAKESKTKTKKSKK